VAAVADLFWEQNHHWNFSNHRHFFYFGKIAGGVDFLLKGRFMKKTPVAEILKPVFRAKFLYLQFQKKVDYGRTLF